MIFHFPNKQHVEKKFENIGRKDKIFAGRINRLRDKQELKFERIFENAIKDFKKRINLDKLANEFLRQKPDLDAAIPFGKLNTDMGQLKTNTKDAIDDAANITTKATVKFTPERRIRKIEQVEAQYVYDAQNPRISKWIESNTGKNITALSKDTRQGVTEVVRRLVKEINTTGMDPRRAARRLMNTIGMNKPQAQALNNFVQNLTDEKLGKLTMQQRQLISRGLAKENWADPNIRKKVLSNVNRKGIDSLEKQYSQKLIKDRAKMVARTEANNAVSAGQQEVWNQMSDEGILNANNTMKEWITTIDEKTSEEHLEMNGTMVPLNEPFVLPDGNEVMYPSESRPNCRCTMSLRPAV